VIAAPVAMPAAHAAAPAATASPSVGLVDVADATPAGISEGVLRLALSAVTCAVASGDIEAPPTLTVIDYSLPSTEPRLWVFDLATGELLFKELVAHGRNTGDNMATAFSDRMNSRQSSLGMFVTDETYVGSNGYSLRLDGLEPGFNARARERAIVMHGAAYVNAGLAASQGRIGRSWGCPALREAVARHVIDTIRGGGVIFSYYPDSAWLTRSRFLNGCGAAVATH
jgi:hypothetical protein